jgi:nucleoside-diphosphate-sugar epimerase
LKILITGGIGFIGSSLAIELSKYGYKIILFDIRDNNKGEKIYEKYMNISFVKGDINDSQLLTKIFRENTIDGVIHLAAVSRVIDAEKNPEQCIRTNITGFETIVKSIQNIKNKKPWLIFGSSREVYGEPKILPVNENFEKKHINIYGESKIKGEQISSNYALENNVSTIILRFSNVYGNKHDLLDRVVPKFITSIANENEITIEGGKQIIDFTHIDDTVHAIVQSIEYIKKNEQIINDFHILPGVGWSLHDLIEVIESKLNKKAKLKINSKRKYDVEKFIGDPSKMKAILKTREFLSLKEGIEQSIPKYLESLKCAY